jgi:hypothetical protein
MILDFEADSLPAGKEFDVCIVGSGAAGLTLAHQLLRRGHRVLLLEGGGRSRWERKSQALNKSYIGGQTFNGAHSGRFRALGGTTSAWSGQVMELDDLDFRSRDWVEGSSWPIQKSELERFYLQARELEGTDTLLHDDDQVWQCANTEPSPLGEELHISFSRYCPEKKFSRRFADTIDNQRLIVMLHANVVELIPSHDKRRIQSLRFRTLAGKEACCSAQQIVLCLGGIESSRFLLNQSFAPWNENGLVGCYFQDHIACFTADVYDANVNSPKWPYGPFKLEGEYTPKIKLTPGAQKKYGVLNAYAIIDYSDGVFETLRTGIKVIAGPASAVGLREFARMTPRVPVTVWHYFKTKRDPNYISPWAKPKLSLVCEQSPLSESRITLSRKRDKLGLLQADITWRISEQEVKTLRTYTAIAKKAFEARGIARVIPDPDLHTDKIYDKCIDYFHHCGGTKMAARRQDGVVDPDLRLNGVENTYVCSSSVFPCSGVANPTHTIVALAARLAEHLDSTLTTQGRPA